MMRGKRLHWGACATILGLVTMTAGAASVPHTFTSGQPALASEVNQNFSALESAINNVSGTSFGNEYYISPSSTGDLGARNVIVLKADRGGDGSCNEDIYKVRLYFTNTNGTSVRNATGATTPARIWIFGFVCAQRGTGTVTYQSEYVYAVPSNGDFSNAEGVEINEDLDGDGQLDDNNQAYGYRQTFDWNPLRASEVMHSNEIYLNASGEMIVGNSFSQIISNFGRPLTVNGKTFSDVVVADHVGINRLRYRASGIGVIQEINDPQGGVDDPIYNNQSMAKAIFYRIEGGSSTGFGGLSGTPFDSGNASAGLWFQ